MSMKDGFTHSAPSNVTCLERSSQSAAGDHEDPLGNFYAEGSSDFGRKDGKASNECYNRTGKVQFDVQTPTGRYNDSDRPNKVCIGTSDFWNQS